MPRTPFAALPLALALLGCHSAPGTLAPAPTPPAGSLRASSEVLAARFQLTVDPATMSATAVPLPARTGTVQAISYDLALSNFMRPNTFEVAAVRYDTDGDLRIDFTHTHPFPAPDLTQPGRRANSADLGYTGRVLVLADGAPATFFGDVTLDPALVKDPDGYLRPGSVLPVPGPRNTFPYMLLADEARNNRVGVPNGGAPTGNYDPAAFGWQRANMGTGNNRWTGYDFIHHGQAIRNRITLRRSALGSTPRTFEIALVIKWTDPKATAADKLPPETPDPLKFAYRLPFAALDISAVDPSTVQIARTGGATALVGAAVRDWDALAAVSADANLSDEPNVALIQPNGDGIPAVELSAPALAPTPLTLGYTSSGNGLPFQELQYAGTLTNSLGTAPVGATLGLLRITDPENGDPQQATYKVGLAPDLMPATPIQSITYQTVSITVTEPVTPPAEVLVVTAAYGEGHPLAGQTQLVQVLPSKVPVPNTLGTDLGAVNSDLFPNNPLRALYIDTLGDTNTIDVPSGSGKIGIGAFKGVHPGIAPGAVAGIPATQPFVFIRGDLGSPALWIADAIDGGLWQALPPGPRPLPGLTLMGETLYADMAGPDWNPGNGTQIAASLGTGITVQSGLPPVLANGDIYRYDIANPLTAPTKVTNARTNNTQGFFYPDWHPTENRAVCLHVETILFIPYFRLSTINMASGASTNLNLSGMGSPPAPATSYIPITPVYNRDGSKIAFAALEVDLAAGEIYDADVWVYTVSGGAVTNVTNTNDVFEGYPAFN